MDVFAFKFRVFWSSYYVAVAAAVAVAVVVGIFQRNPWYEYSGYCTVFSTRTFAVRRGFHFNRDRDREAGYGVVVVGILPVSIWFGLSVV